MIINNGKSPPIIPLCTYGVPGKAFCPQYTTTLLLRGGPGEGGGLGDVTTGDVTAGDGEGVVILGDVTMGDGGGGGGGGGLPPHASTLDGQSQYCLAWFHTVPAVHALM